MAITSLKNKKLLDDLLETCRLNLPTVNQDLVTKAFELSYEAHKNDFRASSTKSA